MHEDFHLKFSTKRPGFAVKSGCFPWKTLWKLWETDARRYTFLHTCFRCWIPFVTLDVENGNLLSNGSNQGFAGLYQDVLSKTGMEKEVKEEKENNIFV